MEIVITNVFGTVFTTLTPVQRWSAARNSEGGSASGQLILPVAAAVLIIISLILIWVAIKKVAAARAKKSNKVFVEVAQRRGFSQREQKFLMAVAHRGDLSTDGDIFTDQEAFNRGVNRLIEQARVQKGHDVSERIKNELLYLSEKLGYNSNTSTVQKGKRAHNVTSRHIPAGKTIHITRRAGHSWDTLSAKVIENNAVDLVVKIGVVIRINFGENWRVRYHFGASVWEFDTTVVSCDGNVLVFKHSDNVRFVNRRRFVRVPVHNVAFISRFPFSRNVQAKKKAGKRPNFKIDGSENWEPLEFVHALVTELAGPGLKLETSLELQPGERVLVVLKLDEQSQEKVRKADDKSVSRIIEDIGEVRRCEPTEDGFSIAIELVGLADSDVNELIRVTNLVSSNALPGENEDVIDEQPEEAEEIMAAGEVSN
jgi:hypothetical protein